MLQKNGKILKSQEEANLMSKKVGRKDHYQGKKARGCHTTIIDAAKDFVAMAEKMKIITGICPGRIVGRAKSRIRRVKFLDTDIGLVAKVSGNDGTQTFRLHTSDHESVKLELSKLFT